MPANPEFDAVLWDVVQEHVSEAEFLLSQTLPAFDSPKQTLDSLAQGFEGRLLAQLDALAVSGDAVVDELWSATLRNFSTASRSLLPLHLANLKLERQTRVVAELSSDVAIRRCAAEDALALLGGTQLVQWLQTEARRTYDPGTLATMLRLAARRGVTLEGLEAWLRSEDREVASAAAQAARSGLSDTPLTSLEALLDHADAGVRDAALGSALVLGSSRAEAKCRARVTRADAGSGAATLCLALSGKDEDYAVLSGALAAESPAEAAVHAVGYAGRVDCIPRLLELMSSGSGACRRLAGEAFSNLTGIALEAPEYTLPQAEGINAPPALDADDADANLVATAVQSLPLPNPAAVARCWKAREASVSGEARVLGGKPWSGAVALDWLRSAPLRQRHPVAMWLALRTRGRAIVDTRALTPVQRAQLEACEIASIAVAEG